MFDPMNPATPVIKYLAMLQYLPHSLKNVNCALRPRGLKHDYACTLCLACCSRESRHGLATPPREAEINGVPSFIKGETKGSSTWESHLHPRPSTSLFDDITKGPRL